MKNFALKHHVLIAFLAFIALSIFFTYPLIEKFSTAYPAGGRDSYQVYATIDSRGEIIKNLGWQDGIKYLVNERLINNYLPYILANQFINVYATNNLLFLLSLILSGLGAYLLTYYLTKNKLASFLAGIFFAFNPFHIYQSIAIHVGSMHQEVIPFFILALFKFFEKYKLRYFFLLGIMAFLTALVEHQLLAFMVLFIIFFLAYHLITDRKKIFDKKLLYYGAASIILMAVVIYLFFAPLFKVAVSDKNYLAIDIMEAINLSVRPLDPLVPPSFHGIWPAMNDWVQDILPLKDKKGENYYVSFTALAVLIFLIYRFKRQPDKFEPSYKKAIHFWLLATLTFFILSLGPAFDIGKHKLYLPYYLIYRFFPFFENIRTVGRLYVFVMLGVSILLAFGFTRLSRKFPKKLNKNFITLLLAILLEFSLIPMKTQVIAYSPFYERLAAERGTFTLLEIPGSTNSVFASFEMITNNVHKKPIINGIALVREIDGQYDLQENTPILRELLYRLPQGKDPLKKISPEDLAKGNEILAGLGIKYITISKSYMEPHRVERTVNFIEAYLKYDEKYEDEYLIAYRLPWNE